MTQQNQTDDFFTKDLSASELVARLLEEEKRSVSAPRSSGISIVILDR